MQDAQATLSSSGPWQRAPLLLLLLAAAVLLGGCSSGDPGTRGAAGRRPPQMDERFVDEDGDLVADAPNDPSLWVDPPVLVFGYAPFGDPADDEAVWHEFSEHLSQTTGKPVELHAMPVPAAQLQALCEGRLDVTGFNTGSVPTAVNLCGFVPFAMMADRKGSYGYEMEIVVPAASSIKRVPDLRGHRLAFTQPASNSGYKAPTVLLKSEFGLQVGRDYEPIFTGRHENSILGVARGEYEAAAIGNELLRRMVAHGEVDPRALRSVYKSRTFPTAGFGYAYNLHPKVAERVRHAFLSFQWAGTGLEREYSAYGFSQFIPITYKGHWQIVRDIDAALGVRYTLGPTLPGGS